MNRLQEVFVEAPARLHFGVLDLRGARGRWFGGIGAAAPGPSLLVSVAPSERLDVQGEDADRAAGYARRVLAHYGLRGAARVRVHRALPSHSGLGSGTQLAMSIARAIAESYDLPSEPSELARAAGRGRRSAVGTWTFAEGGLVVEGGRRQDSDDCGPLLARLSLPPSWRCVVAVPDAAPGISGNDEEKAFGELPSPPERDVERVAHLVLLALLPAVADGDIDTFGSALTQIQEITGRWFASVQGGTFAAGPASDLVRQMHAYGARGVGQSSWGPAVYGIVDGRDAAVRLAEGVRHTAKGACTVYEGSFPDRGARVWRADSPS
jgi:beta-ribofuranosylaminobenzene 5'-phosphate synthase